MNATTAAREQAINFSSTRFGEISVSPDKVIYFSRGLPGFAALRRFILLDHDSEGIFKWLQSVDDPAVAFLLTNPGAYKPGYTVPLKKSEIDELGIKDNNDVVTLVMVCVSRGEKREVSLNLKGPVVFNSGNMKALQSIIDRDDYPSNFVIKI